MFFAHRHDYTSREMPWPFNSVFGPDLNRSESRLAPARTEVRNGSKAALGHVGAMSGLPESGNGGTIL
jgi:hypothetical protein